jgi:uncharacterized protein (UPF0276 family)
LVGEGLFRMWAERWGVKDIDALLDELDPELALKENWDLFEEALERRGIRPPAEEYDKAVEERLNLEQVEAEARRTGLYDALYDEIDELSRLVLEKD